MSDKWMERLAPTLAIWTPGAQVPTLCVVDGDDVAFDYRCRIVVLRSGVVLLPEGSRPDEAAALFWSAVAEAKKLRAKGAKPR